MKLLLFLATTLIIGPDPGAGSYTCSYGWSSHGTSCYKLIRSAKTWPNARSYCRSINAHLATIPDSGTQSFLVNYIIPSSDYNIWFGLNDLGYENVWYWADSTSYSSYRNWASGEPNNYENQDCVKIYAGHGYGWDDSACSDKSYFICQKAGVEQGTKTLSADSGLLLSPFYLLKYTNNEFRKWTIRVADGYAIKLVFYPPFHLEGGSCSYDYVKVYDITSNGVRNLRNTWCGSTLPPVTISTTSTIEVEFRTDGSNLYTGFSASWHKVVPTCGGTFGTNLDKGLILSPNYPSPYENNESCTWTIDVESGYVIKLTFQPPFNVESYSSCGHDSVTVYDVQPNGQKILKGSYCGDTLPKEMISSTTKIKVDFKSDASTVGKGFSISWFKSAWKCGGDYTNTDRGLILSPNYPSPYRDSEFCKWTITVEEGFVIQLIFEAPFDLESQSNCQYDSVKVFNVLPSGGRTPVGTWCGNSLPPIVLSTSPTIHVEFKTDSSGIRKGFSLSWLKVVKPCNSVLEGVAGSVTSPDFPLLYPNNQNCRTEIHVPDGQYVTLEFNSTFDLGTTGDKSCTQDKIEIFDVFGNDTQISRGTWCGLIPPPVVKSFGSRIVLEFHSDYHNNSNGQGFQASWRAVEDCGGVFHANRGYLMSYNYSMDNSSYAYHMAHNNNCTWEIMIAEGFHIQMDFDNSLGANNCGDIEIIDYSLSGDILQPRQGWCNGNAGHQVITSKSHKMLVVLRPNNGNTQGFFASWKSVCGEVFLSDKGNLSSPNYGTKYPPNLNCEWTIVGSKDHVVHLDFLSPFELETTNDNICRYDFVEVFDFTKPNGKLVSKGRFCGHENPQPLISSSSKMVIRFHSDHDKSGKGFFASWDTACGDVFNSNRGELKSPNFPSSYPDNFDCRWEIQAGEGQVIRLKFVPPFSLEENPGCDADYIQLYDISDKGTLVSKGRYCGTDVPPVHKSATSRMVVAFHSDERKSSMGFKATWDSVCGEVFTTAKGTFSSPDYGLEYPPNLDCEWEIKAEKKHVVHLYFNSPFELEATNNDKCTFDYVEVFDSLSDGKLVSKGKFCGHNTPPDMISASTNMVVRFHSDTEKAGKGFSAHWSTACGDVYRGHHGEIKSPDYPSGYPNDFDCRWEIQVTEGHVIRLTFKPPFGLEHNIRFMTDYVELFDLSDEGAQISKGKWTGTDIPSVQKSTTSKMVVVFHSDDRINGAGFHAVWESVCGESFSSGQGNLSSPDYGREYPPNLDCEWEIQGVNKHHIHLVFQAPFELETSNDDSCGFDHVEVFDSMPNGTLVSKGRFCGHQIPPPMVSSSSKVVIRFHSDKEKSGKGFSVTWDTACGDIYTSNKGELMSPNYPTGYPNNFECRWEIRIDQGHVVRLSFQAPFSLEDNTRFIADYVELFDFSDKGALISKGKWSGTNIPPVQKSTTSKMVVVFHSDDRINGAGFKAVWDSVCGDVYTTDQGHFTSPGYPLSYPNNLDCRWEVSVSKGKRVRLHFDSSFDLESDRLKKCGHDNVQVIDYFANGTKINQSRLCGVQKPPEIISSTPKLIVLFHSDNDKNGKGFNVSWDTVGGCGGTIQTKDGYFMSPNYPMKYPENQDCRWTINPPGGSTFTLLFDPMFEIEQGSDCAWDYVQVLRDDKNVGRWCGKNRPPPLTSNGKQLVVIFKSDKSNGGKGFFASWTTDQH